MKRLISLSLAIFTCACVLLATEHRAYAYVDPGTGLLALQSVGAALATASYVMRRRIMALFGKKPAPAPAAMPIAQMPIKTDSRKTA